MKMDTPLNKRTEVILRRLVRRQAGDALKKVLARTRSEDIAAAMEHLTWSEQRHLYKAIKDRDQAAEILAMLPDESVREVSRELTEEFMVDVLDRMELDDATDIVSVLPDELRARVFAGMDNEDEEDVRELLAWPADSAGGIMSPDFFSMPDTATCGTAIRRLQQSTGEFANVYYVYIVDGLGRLLGVASLRKLVVRPPNTPLVSVMTRDPIAVSPREDQEEVARFVARYDLLAIPVVDDQRKVIGIVTVDDVVDVIREEAEEDMMKMAGISEGSDTGSRAIFQQVRQRAGWLLATSVGGILMAEAIQSYESGLAAIPILGSFIPVIIGMAGNVGMQCATVAVRGLATGHVQLGGLLNFIVREVRVGLGLGVIYGLLLGAYGVFSSTSMPMVGVAFGLSIMGAIAGASVLGAGIPLGLSRLKIDPALATGPLVTTVIDVSGIMLYFTIAKLLLPL